MANPGGNPNADRSALERVVASIVAGLICGVLAVMLSIGVGSLLFAVNLHSHLPAAIGLAIAATVVIATMVALTSSMPGMVAVVQEVPVVALAAVVGAVTAAMPEAASQDETFATVVTSIVIATVASGVVAVCLGSFRLGMIIRFVPYPVVGGFLAGTGWLIVLGGVSLILGPAPELSDFARLGEAPLAANAALTAAFVVILAYVQARVTNGLVLPAVILSALVLFNIAIAILGIDTETLRAFDWLVKIPAEENLWPPLGFDDFALVNWTAVAIGMISVPTMILMTIMSMLLNDTGIELETRTDLDLDHELRAVGGTNVVAGVAGGMPGFPSVSLTLLALRLGASTRLVGVLVSAVALGALLLGAFVLDVIPTFLLGGMLIWIGGGLLFEWLIQAFRRLGRWEYLVILFIFGAIIGIGFTEGIALGLAAAVVLFVIQYAQVDTIRVAMTARDFQSSATVSDERRKILNAWGDSILIIRLQGFLFFGTADRLRHTIATRVTNAGDQPVRSIIVDFARVTGLDSSTVLSFTRLSQIAEQDGFLLVFSGLSPALHQTMSRSGLTSELSPNLRIEPDVDAALRGCEAALIEDVQPDFSESRPRPLDEMLSGILDDESMAGRLAPYLEKVVIPPDTRLIEEGAASDDILLVESGHATVEFRTNLRATVRLVTIGPGAIVGEIAYYLREPRSANITSDDEMVVWRLSRAALDRVKDEAPEVALAFHEAIATLLSRRLIGTNRVLRFLAD